MQKYTNEEKREIQEMKLKYDGEWKSFVEELRNQFRNTNWDQKIDEEELPHELSSFIETYFAVTEELEFSEDERWEEEAELEETERAKRPLDHVVAELRELQTVLNAKRESLDTITSDERKRELNKEIRTLNKKLKKVHREISERTLGGQVYLVLSDGRIREHFQKFWLDSKVIGEMDYQVFFAVNQKPVKDNRGEYTYKKGPRGEFLLDKNGHPIIDHDLDESAEAFVKFAKEQEFDFWRD